MGRKLFCLLFEETDFVGVKLSLHNGLVHGAPLTCFFNVVAAIACSSVIVLSQKTAIHNTRILKGRAHGLLEDRKMHLASEGNTPPQKNWNPVFFFSFSNALECL